MQYFKDDSGQPWAYEDGVPESQMRPGLTRMTQEEEAAHLNPPEPPITADGLKEIVTAFRWEVETGGITMPGGVRVATGIDDQNRITSVVANAERAGLEQVDFKAADGWAKVTLAELQAIATAVALHVQACFSAERAHHEAIDALLAQHQGDAQALQEALDGYDESQGWPVG